jgi:hypothetical protein
MSNILKTSDITAGAAMPIKRGTLDFLFNELADMRKILVQTNAGNTNTAYILYGLVPTITGTSYAFTEGYVYFDSIIYYVPAATITVSGSNIPIFKYNTTSYTTNADPVLFSDNNTYNVHEIRNATISADVTGSGFFDWANVKYFNTLWKDESTATFLNAYWRIYNGNLQFKGLIQANTSIITSGSWFNLPTYARPAENAIREARLVDIGSSTLTHENIIVLKINTTGLVEVVARYGRGAAGTGARFDLTTMNNIPLL